MGNVIRETLILNIISFVIALGGVSLAVWAVVSDRFRGGIDDLFVILSGVLLALLFSLQPILLLRRSGVLARLRARLKRPAQASAQQAPVTEEKVTVE